MNINEKLIEQLARAAHEIFCNELIAQGYQYGPIISEEKKTHSSLVPFSQLSEDEKEQNRGNVRDIPNKLIIIGYTLQPANDKEVLCEFTKDEIEKLSEMEHERWMKQKLDDGWKYAPITDKAKKQHKDIVPWGKLSESDKEKDRIMVRAIPQIVGKAGYKLVKIR